MDTDERAALESELRDIDVQVEQLRGEVRDIADDLRQPDEAGSSRIAVEQLTLIESLERRRADIHAQLYGTDVGDDIDNPAPPSDSSLPRGDELADATALDDEVDALELSALSAATEDSPFNDATELSDRAAPPPPEDDLTRSTRTQADVDHLEVGLAPGADLDALEDAPLESLIEAEILAVDEADPETAALIKDEIDRRQGRAQ